MLQYFAKNFFAPVIIFGHIDEKKHLVITVASDLLTPIKDADALIQIQRWDSFKPHGTIIVNMDQVRGSLSYMKCYNAIRNNLISSRNPVNRTHLCHSH